MTLLILTGVTQTSNKQIENIPLIISKTGTDYLLNIQLGSLYDYTILKKNFLGSDNFQ